MHKVNRVSLMALVLVVLRGLPAPLAAMHPHFSPAQMRQRIEEITAVLALAPPAKKKDRALLLEEMGQLLNETDRFGQAVLAFEQALALAPRDGRLRYNLASIFLLRKLPARAVTALERAVTLEPGELSYQVMLARALTEAGRLEDAARVWQATASVDKLPMGKAEKYRRAAECLERAGKLPAADKAWAQALAATPKDGELIAARGLYLARHGHQARAAEDLGLAVSVAGENTETFTWLVEQGLCLVKAGRKREATPVLQAALAKIDRILASQPTFPEALYFQKARALHALGRHREGLAPLEEAIKILPGEPQYMELGLQLYTAAGVKVKAQECRRELAKEAKRRQRIEVEDREFFARQEEQTRRQWERGRLLREIETTLARQGPFKKALARLATLGKEGDLQARRCRIRLALNRKEPQEALDLLGRLPEPIRKGAAWAALLKLEALEALGRKEEGKEEQKLLQAYLVAAKT